VCGTISAPPAHPGPSLRFGMTKEETGYKKTDPAGRRGRGNSTGWGERECSGASFVQIGKVQGRVQEAENLAGFVQQEATPACPSSKFAFIVGRHSNADFVKLFSM